MSIPSVTLNTPDLPYLDTGGRITQTGLAVVHKGEEVLTTAQVTQGGGGAGGGRQVVELRSDGSQLSDWVMELLRRAVRERGGNMDTLIALSNS
jgi:hypothetical protein